MKQGLDIEISTIRFNSELQTHLCHFGEMLHVFMQYNAFHKQLCVTNFVCHSKNTTLNKKKTIEQLAILFVNICWFSLESILIINKLN